MGYFILFLVLSLLFAFAVGFTKGVCDTLQFHFDSSPFANRNPKFWNPAISWKSKYLDWDTDKVTPRFPFSKSLFVMFTDAWHLFQFMQNVAICAMAVFFALSFRNAHFDVSFFDCILSFILLRGVLQIGFSIAYK